MSLVTMEMCWTVRLEWRVVRARLAAAWKKWREIASLLVNQSIPLKSRGGVYETCIRSLSYMVLKHG